MVVDTRNGMDAMKRSLEFWNGRTLRIGILSNPDARSPGIDPKTRAKDDAGRRTPKTVGEIAIIHELGLGNMPDSPPRSFLAATIEQDSLQIEQAQGEFVDAVFAGNITGEQSMQFVGEAVVDLTKTRIRNGLKPELTEKRKKQKIRAGKRGDTPLINFGQLINSLRWTIVKD